MLKATPSPVRLEEAGAAQSLAERTRRNAKRWLKPRHRVPGPLEGRVCRVLAKNQLEIRQQWDPAMLYDAFDAMPVW